MVASHEGNYVELKTDFNDAWSFLDRKGEVSLITAKNKTPFVAKASLTKEGGRVIRFFNYGTEKARCYQCCWGYSKNDNRTWIGMYFKALDFYIRFHIPDS